MTVVDIFFQDARFTVSPITALSQTVYCSNSDAFRTKHFLNTNNIYIPVVHNN
jgi:hypothetical protein